ncbi:hypothetical protein IHE55_17055 [Streptomyces pactum]|uniref:DUF4199 domain-containing protein n=1 Tax=Streptomyces pactum TaxID=68249 RepID=A0ABS0NMV4_9ACTN|nr:hypothetical protein [Streptomyces pactum]MBH5336394.1 hypothetical protein [Streptomyces pactum]
MPSGTAGGATKMVGFAIAGAVVAFIGTFLNWSYSDTASGGVKGKEFTDGVIVMIAAGLAAAALVAVLAAKKPQLSAAGAGLSLIALVVGVLNLVDPDRAPIAKAESEAEDAGATVSDSDLENMVERLDFSAAPGVYLVVLGSLAAVVCGFLAFKNSRTAR